MTKVPGLKQRGDDWYPDRLDVDAMMTVALQVLVGTCVIKNEDEGASSSPHPTEGRHVLIIFFNIWSRPGRSQGCSTNTSLIN